MVRSRIGGARLALVLALMLPGIVPAHATGSRNLAVQSVPPPRTGDLVTLVREHKGDTARMQERLRMVEQEPPPGLSREQRVEFLEDRALAADYLGHSARRLADLREIVELVRGTSEEPGRLYFYGLAQMFSGDVREGVQALQQVVAYPRALWGILNNSHALLAYIHAEMGQLDKAEVHVREARWFLGQLQRNPGGAAYLLPNWEMMVLLAESRLLVARGKGAEAEAAMRRMLEQFARLGGITPGDRFDPARLFEMMEKRKELSGMLSALGLNGLSRTVNRSVLLQTPNVLFGMNLGYTNLAQQLMRQGRFDEAELMLRDLVAANLKGGGRYSLGTVQSLTQLADLLGARGRHAEAIQLLAEAEEIADAMQVGAANQVRLQLVRTRLGIHILRQDWRAAAAEEDARAARLKALDLQNLGTMSPGLGIALVRVGRAPQAVRALQALLQQRLQVLAPEHIEVAEIRGVLAMGLAAMGQKPEAGASFAQAGAILLGHGAQDADARHQGMNGLIRRLVLEAWLDLLADTVAEPQAAATAFRIADALHSGRTQQALVQSAARAAARQADLGELVRKEQDSRTEQAALYGQLLRLAALPPEQQLPQVMADMRQRIKVIDQERVDVQVTIERRFPAYADLVQPRSPTLDEARQALRSNEALLNILSTDQSTYVWAVRRDGAPAFVRVPLTREMLDRMVQDLRKALDPGPVDIARSVPDFDLETAYRLYELLLKPVELVWRGAEQLLVVGNGALGRLPLALLPTAPAQREPDGGMRYGGYRKVPWLVRQAALVQLPSVHSLVTLRRMPAGDARRKAFTGFGDPDFGAVAETQTARRALRNLVVARFAEAATGSSVASVATPQANWVPYSDIPPLPDTREEILALAQALQADPQRDVFLGREASKARVKQMDLARSRVVAFATHGLLPGEFPGVDQPALALANPGNGEHGLLTLEEILGLKLNADWVVLSACNTAAGDGAGAEAVSGLGRGFFYAGTRALLATHWPVESASARLLVTGAFERQVADVTVSRAQALRQSMLSVMEQRSDAGFSFAHPLFWAPYTLIGDGG